MAASNAIKPSSLALGSLCGEPFQIGVKWTIFWVSSTCSASSRLNLTSRMLWDHAPPTHDEKYVLMTCIRYVLTTVLRLSPRTEFQNFRPTSVQQETSASTRLTSTGRMLWVMVSRLVQAEWLEVFMISFLLVPFEANGSKFISGAAVPLWPWLGGKGGNPHKQRSS